MPRFGFTITRKVGTAVLRNRIRRRLKAALSGPAGEAARAGHDYVLVVRAEAGEIPFEELCQLLRRALVAVHDGPMPKGPRPGRSDQATR